MRHALQVAALIAASQLALGCVNTSQKMLPGAAIAKELGGPDSFPVFLQGQVSDGDLAVVAPFAIVAGASNASSQDSIARRLAKKASRLRPDVLLISDARPHYRGIAVWGFCYRAQPAMLGISTDENEMVTGLRGNARSCGILEGDTVISYNGAAVRAEDYESPHYREMLKVGVGETVKVVWIRPGSGRMEGEVVTVDNPKAWMTADPEFFQEAR